MKILYNKIADKCNNIVNEEDLREITLSTLDVITEAIGATVGPYGRMVLINEIQSGHLMTKDGFTVAKHLQFPGEISNVIHHLITTISQKLVEEVGDGSSSSVIAANKLYKMLIEIIDENNIRPQKVTDILEKIKEYCIANIEKQAKPVSEDMHELQDIATISVNNDAVLGKLIADAYKENGREGFISVKIGKGEYTKYETAKGFQISYGYADPILINNPELKECNLDNPLVIMFDSGLHDTKWTDILNNLMISALKTNTNIILIMSSYGKIVQNWFRKYTMDCKNNHINPKLNIITMPTSSKNQFAQYEDLAIKLGATIINTIDKEEDDIEFNLLSTSPNGKKIQDYAGKCESVISRDKITTFLNAEGDKLLIDSRISDIKEELSELKSDDVLLSETYRLTKRLAVLTDKLTTIYVGGISDQEKISKKALIDDAIGACRSTLLNGYVEGCNRSLVKAVGQYIKEHDKDSLEGIFALALFRAILAPYQQVRKNGRLDYIEVENYEDFTNKFDELISEKLNIADEVDVQVINSAKTDIEIIKTITSMIGLLITSSIALTANPNSTL